MGSGLKRLCRFRVLKECPVHKGAAQNQGTVYAIVITL